MRKKQYCILNKQYTKEEFEIQKKKIIENMNTNPYIDKLGRIWKYGDFFPYDLSMFDYTESSAMQLFPLSKDDVLEKGFRWREEDTHDYKATIQTSDIPDSIHDIDESILKEVIKCSDCDRFYRIVKAEFDLLKRFKIPVPRQCPYCRHMERLRRLNPPELWKRKCDKCQNDIKTSYAPNRPEIVYCEKCYQKEVI